MVSPSPGVTAAGVPGLNSRLVRRGILILLAAILSCTGSDRSGRSQIVRVREVIDGDTVVLTDGREVRYMCIDSPERDEPYYEEAKQLNRELVEGKTVWLRFGKRAADRHGRRLARVMVDDLWVADSLVSAGLARVYGFRDNAEFLPPLIITQRRAIDRRAGFWAALPIDDEKYYIASTVGYRFHRPGCRSALRIRDDRRITYKARIDAYYDGRSPCGDCRP